MFDNILIKTPEQIEGIRAACRDAALVLDYIEPFVKAGVTTEYLDDLMLRYPKTSSKTSPLASTTTRTAPILIRKLPAFPQSSDLPRYSK